MIIIFMVFGVALVQAGLSTESYKGQYCTDPRTMRKHAAYTEWADAYSCTRHRCQPGGRNLAIYTVGCKRVEAPESAIECEEVVEDTNMQFPFCCTRLRCLVVVRGEVWTRVLGQPWETLPAAPWSHMYKMKKPPPENSDFLPKGPEKGPVYELVDPEAEKVLRAAEVTTVQPSLVAQPPDIVIALGTNTDPKLQQDIDRQSRMRKSFVGGPFVEDEKNQFQPPDDPENNQFTTEKSQGDNSGEERYYESGTDENTQNQKPGSPQTWTDIPSQQWFLKTDGNDADNNKQETIHQSEGLGDKAEPKSVKLQQLVNAIGTRMRDIESVVQRMSEKVHEGKTEDGGSLEKGQTNFNDMELGQPPSPNEQEDKVKKPNTDSDYKRFTEKKHSKYLHTAELTTDIPLYLEDTNLQGYFSDASNSVLRRANKASGQTYMAPVDTRRKNTKIIEASDTERKHKKHHKKKKAKHMHKKHHKPEARKKFNIITSTEEKTMPRSLEDSDSAVRK